MNAYADAVAKAYLYVPLDGERVTRELLERQPNGARVQLTQTADGWVPWLETRFTALRDAAGVWARRQIARHEAASYGRAARGTRRKDVPRAPRGREDSDGTKSGTGAYGGAQAEGNRSKQRHCTCCAENAKV